MSHVRMEGLLSLACVGVALLPEAYPNCWFASVVFRCFSQQIQDALSFSKQTLSQSIDAEWVFGATG